MNETNLTPRQNIILTLINQSQGISRLEIEQKVADRYPASKPTIARDLNILTQKNLIKVSGKGKNTTYLPKILNPLLWYVDLEKYFSLEADERLDSATSFDFTLFDHLQNLFSEEEIKKINRVNKSFSQETKKLTEDLYNRELERFVIELSWKSSKIEGNTY
ncbi:BlaI/MecI/CopY family transcriptional regulator, partial [Candidatus Daviesbacteria bacterium]|nr:BlaI/MecI/CopY family transcriptional regulator [Candidatus Daviesbacteria bacterium]